MNYSIAMITTVSDCDNLLSLAERDKADLAVRKIVLEKQRADYSTNSIDIETELTAVNAVVSTYQNIVNSLPNGDDKNDWILKLKRKEAQQFSLTNRRSSYGALAVLEKERDIAIVEKEIAETEAFIAAITERKAQL